MINLWLVIVFSLKTSFLKLIYFGVPSTKARCWNKIAIAVPTWISYSKKCCLPGPKQYCWSERWWGQNVDFVKKKSIFLLKWAKASAVLIFLTGRVTSKHGQKFYLIAYLAKKNSARSVLLHKSQKCFCKISGTWFCRNFCQKVYL